MKQYILNHDLAIIAVLVIANVACLFAALALLQDGMIKPAMVFIALFGYIFVAIMALVEFTDKNNIK